MPHDAANAEMSQFWNAAAGEAWVAQQDALDLQLEPLGSRAAARAAIARGEQVLDIAIARLVAPSGRVAAVDISEPMLARAQRRAREAGLDGSIEWMRADAQTAALGEARFDCAFSRFGVMFFSDPAGAFRNVARALRTGGRVAFVCWQARERNPWFTAPARAAAQHVALPAPPAPDAPGPFAFADPARVRAILGTAGLADVAIEAYEEPMRLAGGDLEGALALTLLVGPLGAALREANASEAQRERVVAAVRASLEQFLTPRGVEAPAAAWIVSARRP